jgi:NADP-dependent 3-hydroxy acid dehydrogenase YdfG
MSQRLAVVSGASSGIGAATARLLGAEGWRVVLIARRAERLAAVAAEVESAGGAAEVAALDASDGAAVAALGERVVAAHGAPHAVVNSAGAGVWRWPEETTDAEMERALDAPYRAAWYVTRAFLPAMLAARRGAIVHVGSPASLVTWPSATSYTAARWALRGLHEALRQDLVGTGVTTSHVLFGEVATEYFDVNPDSHDSIPGLGRLAGVIDAERCARIIRRTIERPRAQVLDPPLLAAMQVMNRVSPGLVRLLARRSGRRRPPLGAGAAGSA